MSTKKTLAPRVAPQHADEAKPTVRRPVITPVYWANHPSDPKDKPRTVAYWTLSMDGLYLDKIPTEALARKIAAVDDLFSALEVFCDQMDSWSHHLPDGPRQKAMNQIQVARAAISKATQP